MAANLEVFEKKAEESSRKGVQLLVTPEYGLTGFPGSVRSQWWDYAIDIPDFVFDGCQRCNSHCLNEIAELLDLYDVA